MRLKQQQEQQQKVQRQKRRRRRRAPSSSKRAKYTNVCCHCEKTTKDVADEHVVLCDMFIVPPNSFLKEEGREGRSG